MPTTEYTEALLSKVRDSLTAEEFTALHKLALPSAGGRARARKQREAREALNKADDPAAGAYDTPVTIDSLDPDVAGAMYELAEFAGLIGDEGEDEDFDGLPAPVQSAIHLIAVWADYVENDPDETEGTDAEPGSTLPPPVTKVKKGEPDGSDVGPVGLMNAKKATKPHKFAPVGDGSSAVCATCGQPAGYLAHKSPSTASKVSKAVRDRLSKAANKPMEGSFEDLQALLLDALRAKYANPLGNCYVYTRATTADSVAFTVDGGAAAGSYQCDYTVKDGKVTLGDPKPVEFRTVAVAKAFDIVSDAPIWIEKGDKQAQQIVYGVVLSPGIKDSHGDVVTAEHIEKAAHAFLIKQQRQAVAKGAHNRQHTAGEVDAEPVESYIAPVDFEITNPRGQVMQVLKGAWVMASKVHDKALFTEVEKGEKVTGFSIEGSGLRFEDAA